MDQFPVASELLNGLMAAVMREVRRSDTLRGKLYQVRALLKMIDCKMSHAHDSSQAAPWLMHGGASAP